VGSGRLARALLWSIEPTITVVEAKAAEQALLE
jgi:hypothetical protein